MIQNRQKKQKILWGRVLDCLLLIIFPIISMYLILLINKFTDKYTLLAAIVLLVLYSDIYEIYKYNYTYLSPY